MINNKLQFEIATYYQLIKKIGFIDGYNTIWQQYESKQKHFTKDFLQNILVESIAAAFAFEEQNIDKEQVAEILKNSQNSDNELLHEVLDYYGLQNVILDSYSDFELADYFIKEFHSILLTNSNKSSFLKGQYKLVSNRINGAFDDNSSISISTTMPFKVEGELNELLDWYTNARTENIVHPLILSAVFFHEFLLIFPFQKSNLKLALILLKMLFLKDGYLFVNYLLIEKALENNKKQLFTILADNQSDRSTQTDKLDSWVLALLVCYIEAITNKPVAEAVVGAEVVAVAEPEDNSLKGYLNTRQKKIVELIRKHQPVKISDIAKFTKQSLNTIKKDLQHLKKEGIVESEGKNKGTIHFLKS